VEENVIMAQLVPLARAARMLGITRSELQQQIGSGQLPTFEGQIDLEALRQAYPTLSARGAETLDRAERIKETAFGRRVAGTVLPTEEEVMATKLRRLQTDLDVERARARRMEAVIQELGRKLVALHACCNDEQRLVLVNIKGWLRDRLAAS
jgi:CDP-4-dehydro-6-deoxyglucose reductase